MGTSKNILLNKAVLGISIFNLSINKMWVLLVVLLKLVACQKDYDTDDFQFTTNDQQITVTYNSGQDCLPYDGSVVPDCSKYIDPVTKEPYYKEHSSNCSRFWECGPGGETCLFECAACGGPSNPMCHGQWALTFDPSYQYPNGPVCDWPSNIDCGVECDHINKPDEFECCLNEHCDQCDGGYCSLFFQCVYPGTCECKHDSDCNNWDGTCNVPAPHDPDNCAYCSEEGTCLGGCGGLDNDPNCPDGYHCNQDTHLCESGTCDGDEFCEGHDVMCNANYDNCFFCGGDCGSDNGCCEGCHDSTLNCPYPTPVCQDDHECGCNDNDDLKVKMFVIQTSTNVRRSLMSANLTQRLRTVMQMLLVNVTLINLYTHSASTVTQKDLITSANQDVPMTMGKAHLSVLHHNQYVWRIHMSAVKIQEQDS